MQEVAYGRCRVRVALSGKLGSVPAGTPPRVVALYFKVKLEGSIRCQLQVLRDFYLLRASQTYTPPTARPCSQNFLVARNLRLDRSEQNY